jgi:hypothetical protein
MKEKIFVRQKPQLKAVLAVAGRGGGGGGGVGGGGGPIKTPIYGAAQ